MKRGREEMTRVWRQGKRYDGRRISRGRGTEMGAGGFKSVEARVEGG